MNLITPASVLLTLLLACRLFASLLYRLVIVTHMLFFPSSVWYGFSNCCLPNCKKLKTWLAVEQNRLRCDEQRERFFICVCTRTFLFTIVALPILLLFTVHTHRYILHNMFQVLIVCLRRALLVNVIVSIKFVVEMWLILLTISANGCTGNSIFQ